MKQPDGFSIFMGMKILLLDPFMGLSHKAWANGYQKYSSHEIKILGLSGHHWKWRMHGGAITLARKFNQSDFVPDLILATDMLDLNLFLSLTRANTSQIPVALYYHENQLTYPWSVNDSDILHLRDNHYGFINFTGALNADANFFNSAYHYNSFLSALPSFLKQFPDHNELQTVEIIKSKSQVLELGLDLQIFDKAKRNVKRKNEIPVLLWNHRWDYDKNPDQFFDLLKELKSRGFKFKLIVLGQGDERNFPVFTGIRDLCADELIQFGHVDSMEEYASFLCMADILPVTSNQDFFGASVIEAVYCGVTPILPNRLAYPEHFNEEVNQWILYSDFQQLIDKVLNYKEILKEASLLDKMVLKYDWQFLAGKYDDIFNKLIKS
jgi:glycosyltransferase involved in cell wall biosynthesis